MGAISEFVTKSKQVVNSLFLKELRKGLSVTGWYFFQPKITVQYPEEKHRKAAASAVCMPCVAILMGKSVALPVSFAKRSARPWPLPSNPINAMTVAAAPHVMTLI